MPIRLIALHLTPNSNFRGRAMLAVGSIRSMAGCNLHGIDVIEPHLTSQSQASLQVIPTGRVRSRKPTLRGFPPSARRRIRKLHPLPNDYPWFIIGQRGAIPRPLRSQFSDLQDDTCGTTTNNTVWCFSFSIAYGDAVPCRMFIPKVGYSPR